MRFKGDESYDTGHGFKMLYTGKTTQKDGVGIVLSKELQDTITKVYRGDGNRVMSVQLAIGDEKYTLICAYAPQVGCSGKDKDGFWDSLL